MSETIWTTRDGRRLKLSEMTDGHLRNAYNLVTEAEHPVPPCFDSEDLEMEMALVDSFVDHWISEFQAEARRRGIEL